MAAIVRTKIGYMVQLSPHEDPQRPKISLGKIKERDAIGICRHIETLVAVKNGSKMPTDTQKWAEGICHGLRSRLEALGLLERSEKNRWTVSSWVEHYITSRSDAKPATLRKWKDSQHKLRTFFANDAIGDVTTQHAKNYMVYLKSTVKLSENSLRRHIGIARQFFNAAVDAEILTKNPFKSRALPVSVKANESRFFYVDAELSKKVLDAMPDAEWRLIFGLARWGGLRCPSEVVALKWSDIDWERSRFTVHSPKTEHHTGQESRVVPMFPELRPLFQAAFDDAPDGAVYCVNRYKDGREVNLRQQFGRWLDAAGIDVWQKPFQNCRSTRESELFKTTGGNVKAVCKWLGNSPAVALQHYAQVTDADMKQATEKNIMAQSESKVETEKPKPILKNEPKLVHAMVHNLVHDIGEITSMVPQVKKEGNDITPCNDKNLRELSESCCTPNNGQGMGDSGLEPETR